MQKSLALGARNTTGGSTQDPAKGLALRRFSGPWLRTWPSRRVASDPSDLPQRHDALAPRAAKLRASVHILPVGRSKAVRLFQRRPSSRTPRTAGRESSSFTLSLPSSQVPTWVCTLSWPRCMRSAHVSSQLGANRFEIDRSTATCKRVSLTCSDRQILDISGIASVLDTHVRLRRCQPPGTSPRCSWTSSR